MPDIEQIIRGLRAQGAHEANIVADLLKELVEEREEHPLMLVSLEMLSEWALWARDRLVQDPRVWRPRGRR